MKMLMDIWGDLKAGDIICYEPHSDWDGSTYKTVGKIKIATVVAIDVWDMASVVGVVDLCKFDCYGISHPKKGLPVLEWLIEWGTYHFVVGHWEKVPSISEVKKAVRDFRKKSDNNSFIIEK